MPADAVRSSFIVLLMTAIGYAELHAAPGDAVKPPDGGPRLELIVIEARSNCPMCRLFRDVVAPAYALTDRARRAPLRYVDVAAVHPDDLMLAEPVEVIPTVILMRDGAEVDRLVGYTGPEIFLHAVGVMLGDIPAGPPHRQK